MGVILHGFFFIRIISQLLTLYVFTLHAHIVKNIIYDHTPCNNDRVPIIILLYILWKLQSSTSCDIDTIIIAYKAFSCCTCTHYYSYYIIISTKIVQYNPIFYIWVLSVDVEFKTNINFLFLYIYLQVVRTHSTKSSNFQQYYVTKHVIYA